MVSGRHRNRKHHLIGVFLPILFDLLLRQGCKILISNSDYKKGAADNVIRHTVIIGQGATVSGDVEAAGSVENNGNVYGDINAGAVSGKGTYSVRD